MVSHAGPGRSGVGRLASVLSLLRRRAQGRRAQLPDRLRGRRCVRGAPRTRRARPRCAGGELRALERARPARPAAGAPRSHDRCGSPSSRRSSRSSPGSRGSIGPCRSSRPDAARPTTPSLVDLVIERRVALVGGGRIGRLLGRGARPRPSGSAARRRRHPRGAARPRGLRRPQVALDERPLPGGRRARPAKRADRRPRRRRSSTTSVASRCPTPSGTSPARSPATNATGSRPTRWSPTSSSDGSRTPPRLAGPASAAHERFDGSGYHRRLTAAHLDEAQRVIAAADCYQAMTRIAPTAAP